MAKHVEFKNRIPQVKDRLRSEFEERVRQSAETIFEHLVNQVLTGSRTGRTYPSPTGGTYRASAPGEPPAEVTGELKKSYRLEIQSDRDGNTQAVIGSPLERALMLEKGTSRMSPRPHLSRAKLDKERDVHRIMTSKIDD